MLHRMFVPAESQIMTGAPDAMYILSYSGCIIHLDICAWAAMQYGSIKSKRTSFFISICNLIFCKSTKKMTQLLLYSLTFLFYEEQAWSMPNGIIDIITDKTWHVKTSTETKRKRFGGICFLFVKIKRSILGIFFKPSQNGRIFANLTKILTCCLLCGYETRLQKRCGKCAVLP